MEDSKNRSKSEGEQSADDGVPRPMDQGEEGGHPMEVGGSESGSSAGGCKDEHEHGGGSNGDERPVRSEPAAVGEDTSSSASMEIGSSHVATGAENEVAGPSGVAEGAGKSGASDGRPPVIVGQPAVMNSPAPEMGVKMIGQVRERMEGMEQRVAIAKLQAKVSP